MLGTSYLNALSDIIDKISKTQMEPMRKAANMIAARISSGGILYLFGSGHSASVAVEPFHRAGGLVPVRPIAEPSMTLHGSPAKATALERLPGMAKVILDDSGITSDDVLIVISNSGTNAVPVEMCLLAHEIGVPVIAITSVEHSRMEAPRHASGKRLFEIADLVLDNCGVPGDAVLQTDACLAKVGPTSTAAGVAIVNALAAEVVEQLSQMGVEPPVMVSSNVKGGDEYNRKFDEAFTHRRV